MKAKKNPIRKMITDKRYTRTEIFLPIKQAFLSSGSNGQGAFRFLHSHSPFPASMTAAKIKTCGLCSEIQIRPGILVAKPASTAPIPKLTNKAGRAQQIKVLAELNKVRKVKKLFLGVKADFIA